MPRLKPRGVPVSLRGLGERLRLARSESDLSIGELSDEADIPKSSLSLAERDKKLLGLAETVRLCEVTGVRLSWLVLGESPMRGRIVSILVEDQGADSRAIRSDLARELASGAPPQRPARRKARNIAD